MGNSKVSIISNSFKRKAGEKLAEQMGITDPELIKTIVAAWIKGFDCAESMFVELD